MKKYPNGRVKVLVLWAPYLRSDSRRTAQSAAAYLSDARVQHFWDLWKFGTRIYSEQLRYPPEEAWDLFAGYKPALDWSQSIPTPTFYLQNRDLDHGTPYSKETLEAQLQEWLE